MGRDNDVGFLALVNFERVELLFIFLNFVAILLSHNHIDADHFIYTYILAGFDLLPAKFLI